MSNAFVLIVVIFTSSPGVSGSIAMHDFETKDACETAQREINDQRTSNQWPAALVEVFCVAKGSSNK
jgi:hypothetical protein